jgi:NADH-ubiquinone oxidoreductase chain 2
MLSIGLLSLIIAVPLFSYRISPCLFNRLTCIILLYSGYLAYNALHHQTIGSGIGIYSGLFHVTAVSQGIETFLLCIGAILLLGWAPVMKISTGHANTTVPTVSEYSLLILFTTIGASLLVSSSDIVSMYLCIELQSFAVYILATLYRNSESATAAGLKYFLLGGLSSALILLGTALIYSYTGVTQFESIYALTSVGGDDEYVAAVVFGLLLVGIGFLFKVAAAPLHNWAPDVYDGTPTVVTAWLSTIPKISIFIFLLELQTGLEGSFESLSLELGDTSVNVWKNLLLITSLLSLVIGTVLGLSQYRIKRLLTYSTISHVGFLLLALSMNTQESIESLLFYIIQYSLTNVNVFLVLLAFGYIIHASNKRDIQFITSLKGQFIQNPILGLSFALCLFSIAGIPPLIGFFAKQIVLYSSTHGGYYFLSIVAIIVSVISASYYLKIIKVMYFDTADNTGEYNAENSISGNNITSVHAFLISSLTIVITLFVLQPTVLLNICDLLALSLFYY